MKNKGISFVFGFLGLFLSVILIKIPLGSIPSAFFSGYFIADIFKKKEITK
jgi:hypothetical protein